MKLNCNKVGLGVAAFYALFHAFWALLVAIGVARPLLDWILSLHFISFSYTLLPFEWLTAVCLIAMTASVGYVVGLVFAILWNRISI